MTSVWVAGLALDYCVDWSTRDAIKEGFKATVVLPTTAPVTAEGGRAAAAAMARDGVRVLASMPTAGELRS